MQVFYCLRSGHQTVFMTADRCVSSTHELSGLKARPLGPHTKDVNTNAFTGLKLHFLLVDNMIFTFVSHK